jgi:hypothetical protein
MKIRKSILLLTALVSVLMPPALPAAPILNTECPVSFFTNVADRLLRESTANWLNQDFAAFTNNFGASTTQPFGAGNIPVYVGGQFVYTLAVQRLLQVSANVCDATTTNLYPTVFRPLFSTDGAGDVYITGYTNLNSASGPNTVSGPDDVQLSQPFDVTTIAALPVAITNVPDNIYGVPWIIGVKKGFPNFNEFAMENNLAITRRLQLTRITNSSQFMAPTITSTNQMYLMSLTGSLGVELWNSYAASYPGMILIGVNENVFLTITNDDPGFNSHPGIAQPISFSTNIFSNPYVITSWPGTAPWSGGSPNPASFVIATFTGPTLTNSVYRSPYATPADMPSGLVPPSLIPTNYFPIASPPLSLLFESNSPNGFHFPQFGVLMTNRLQMFMLDFTNGVYHVIDYVHFAGPESAYNVNQYLADNDATNNYVGVWDTNYPPGYSPPTGPTYGIFNQIAYSKNGTPPLEDGLWQTDPEAVPLGGTIAQKQAFFKAFFLPGNHFGTTTNLQLSTVTPYAPTRYIVQYITWQANDPLVHYLASDIDEPSPNNTTTPQQGVSASSSPSQAITPLTDLNLGWLNDRFSPWGGNPILAAEGQATQFDPNVYNLAERDPLVYSPDDWNFPAGQSLNSDWLGQVHRGTPWQTIYLKSSNILSSVGGINTWAAWTGDFNISANQYFDAANSAPVQDWHLASLLASLFNTNNFTSLFRVNDPNPNDWQGLLNGLTALTNGNAEIDPVLISSNSPQAVLIAAALESERAAEPGQMFADVGDILATPQLAEQSPFLNESNTNNLTDAACEIIPSQLLSLLRTDSIGSITLTNSQPVVQFTGYDGHPYAIQISSDLVNWTSISTNFPVGGVITFTNLGTQNVNQFYRSVLLQ